ncbi:MAG TPA: outer membrane protein assembly factor BamD [Phycisphaerales bacterium]|nr:outer membrane protein assembly factor BamD [Phycisphaerales bacterium]
MRWTSCLLAFALAGMAHGQNAQNPQTGATTQPARPVEVTPVVIAETDPDRALMAEVRRHIASEQFDEAYEKVNAWIEENETSDSPALPEAYVLRATAQIARHNEFKALFDTEEVARNHPYSDAFPTALERELEVANKYLNGLKRKIWGLRIESGVDIAEEIIVRINERLPGSRLAEQALMDLADYYYRERDLKMAATAYECFVILFPKSEMRQKAMERRIYATIAQFKGPKYDASGLIEAQYQIKAYQELYPREAHDAGLSDALIVRLDESAAAQMLTVANWYMKRGDDPSARLTLTRLVQKHPATAAAAEGLKTMQDKGWVKTEARVDVIVDETAKK